jgi:hypothetical protein
VHVPRHGDHRTGQRHGPEPEQHGDRGMAAACRYRRQHSGFTCITLLFKHMIER